MQILCLSFIWMQTASVLHCHCHCFVVCAETQLSSSCSLRVESRFSESWTHQAALQKSRKQMNPMAFLLLRKRNKPKNRSQNLFCGGLGGCVYWGWGGPLLKVWEEIKITFHKFICRKIHSEEHILKRKAECDQWVSSSAPCCLTLPSHPAKFSNSGKEGLSVNTNLPKLLH